jgi:hypothetical protein
MGGLSPLRNVGRPEAFLIRTNGLYPIVRMIYVFRVRSNDSSSKLYLQIVSDMLSCAMSAGQDLLPCRFLSERFAPPADLQGGDPCWATLAAHLPNHSCAIRSNCARDRRKKRDANTRFWLNLTIFRMNTCTKRVGGWGCRFSTSTLPGGMPEVCDARGTSWVPHPFTLSLEGLALRIEGSWRRGAFKGAVSPCHDPGGVQLHPRRDCVTVRLKVRGENV